MGVLYTVPPRDTVLLLVRADRKCFLPVGRALLLLLFGVVFGRFGNFMVGIVFCWVMRSVPTPEAGRVTLAFMANDNPRLLVTSTLLPLPLFFTDMWSNEGEDHFENGNECSIPCRWCLNIYIQYFLSFIFNVAQVKVIDDCSSREKPQSLYLVFERRMK